MATTTATITLSSSDLLTDNLSLSTSTSLYKHGTASTGLDEMRMERLEIPIDDYGSGTAKQYDLIANSAALLNKPSWVYIANKNTNDTHYVEISIKDDLLGKLYSGDWMFIPWSCNLNAALGSAVEIQAKEATAVIEYAFFNSDFILTAAAS